MHRHIHAMATQRMKFLASWLSHLSKRLEHFKTRAIALKGSTSEKRNWCARESELLNLPDMMQAFSPTVYPEQSLHLTGHPSTTQSLSLVTRIRVSPSAPADAGPWALYVSSTTAGPGGWAPAHPRDTTPPLQRLPSCTARPPTPWDPGGRPAGRQVLSGVRCTLCCRAGDVASCSFRGSATRPGRRGRLCRSLRLRGAWRLKVTKLSCPRVPTPGLRVLLFPSGALTSMWPTARG